VTAAAGCSSDTSAVTPAAESHLRQGDVLMPRGVARSAEEALIVIADKDRQLFEPEEHRP
jgi:hypothetical protein